MLDKLEDTINEALNEARHAQQHEENKVVGRELALVTTKLQEAAHWLKEAQGR